MFRILTFLAIAFLTVELLTYALGLAETFKVFAAPECREALANAGSCNVTTSGNKVSLNSWLGFGLVAFLFWRAWSWARS